MNKKSLYGSAIRAGMEGVQYTANVQLREKGRGLKDIFHFYFFTSKCSGGITENIPQLLRVHLSNQTHDRDGLLKEDCFDYVFNKNGEPFLQRDTDFTELVNKSKLISEVMGNNSLPEELKENSLVQALLGNKGLSCLEFYNI